MRKKVLHCVYTRTDTNCFVWTIIDCYTNESNGEHWWMKYSSLEPMNEDDERGDIDTDYLVVLNEFQKMLRERFGCDDMAFTALYTE